MTHDYKRNATTKLFAARNVVEGCLIGTCMSRYLHQEFIKYLKLIDQQTPAELVRHLSVDTNATHRHPKAQRLLKRHKRFRVPLVPTSGSWVDLVER